MNVQDLKVGEWVYVAEDPNYYGWDHRNPMVKTIRVSAVRVTKINERDFEAERRNWCGRKFVHCVYPFSDYNCTPFKNSMGAQHKVFAAIGEAVAHLESYLDRHPNMMVQVATPDSKDEWYNSYVNGVLDCSKVLAHPSGP